jgi:hypothetical protein
MEHPPECERTDTNSLYIAIFAIVCIVSVISSIFVIDFYFDHVKAQVKKEGSDKNSKVNKLKIEQNQTLDSGKMIINPETKAPDSSQSPIKNSINNYSEKDLKSRETDKKEQ